MSSHHFVKEGQEPALIVLDPVSHSVAEPLLEWAPLVLVSETSIADVLSWGIKVDVAFGENAETLSQMLAHQAPVKVLETKNDALATALYFLISLKHLNVTILVEEPSTICNRLSEFESRMGFSLLSMKERWSLITSGNYSKWLAKGQMLNFVTKHDLTVNGEVQTNREYTASQDGLIDVTSRRPFWIVDSF